MSLGICKSAKCADNLALFAVNACNVAFYANICYLLFIMALFVLKIS